MMTSERNFWDTITSAVERCREFEAIEESQLLKHIYDKESNVDAVHKNFSNHAEIVSYAMSTVNAQLSMLKIIKIQKLSDVSVTYTGPT